MCMNSETVSSYKSHVIGPRFPISQRDTHSLSLTFFLYMRWFPWPFTPNWPIPPLTSSTDPPRSYFFLFQKGLHATQPSGFTTLHQPLCMRSGMQQHDHIDGSRCYDPMCTYTAVYLNSLLLMTLCIYFLIQLYHFVVVLPVRWLTVEIHSV